MYHKVWRCTLSKNALVFNSTKCTESSFQISSRSYSVQLNQRLDEAAKDLNIKQMSDWYQVSSKVFQQIQNLL
ncbi:hypothetical protein HMI54_010221 [Coelomomyces lativittatus]|nr:hypothetical protein HMI54_010221 [Coelomomyces lativittatus]